MAELDKAKVALRKLVAMSAPANGKTTSEGSKEQASQALRQLFRRNGVPKSGDEAGEMEVKFATLLDRVLKPASGSAAASSSTRRPPGSTGPVESPEELAEKMGPEPYKRPLPELPKRPLVLKEEGGFSAPMKLKVIEARKALQKKDQTVTQLTLSLKQCRKEVWKLQCEANAADMKVARLLEKREGELPEDFRDELERLKDKEEELADQLSSARANAQRWASVAKRQDAMLQQEREEQRGDAHSILAKHPAGEVFWTFASDSESEDASPRRRPEVTRSGSSDEDSDRPAAKGKAKAPSYSSESASSGDDSIDLPGTGPSGPSQVTASFAKAKASPTVPPIPARDADEVYSEISEDIEDIPESSRSV